MNFLEYVRRATAVNRLVLATLLASLVAAPAFGQGPPTPPASDQRTFASPDEAVVALASAVAASDKPALKTLFGPASEQLASGDEAADKASYERFAKRLKKMSNLVKRTEDSVVLYVGAENWPFPFPIARSGDRWFFDGEAGLRELFNRRIGENELATIRVCREYVRVQREYASADRDGDEVLEYAQRVKSSPGSKDGLYWETADGDESPLGPLFASATAEGYRVRSEPQPFHGYSFRILTQQGASAPGGAYGYVINGNMIGGFALVAYPTTWGSSGLMTFIVNQQGRVYQKDLGRDTAAIASRMRVYDPDSTWTVVEEE